ncbi:MAG: pitrilysin family protein, partial [Bacteroidota bacterium]
MKNLQYVLFVAIAMMAAACSQPLDRSIRPEPATAPQIKIGDYSTFQLANGLKVIVVENHKLPRVAYQLTVDRDPIMEGDKAGYVSMAGDLLKNGTSSKSKAEIDEAVDFMGANLSTYSTGMFGSSLTKHSESLLTLMQDILMNPAFPEDEVEKYKKQTLSGLTSSKTDPNSISSNISNAMCYGLDHPYGEQQTEATTENITRDDLVGYYSSYFRPNVSYLTIVGDITPAEAETQVKKYFGSWEKADVPSHTYDKPTLPEGNKVCFAPLDGAVQSVIEITFPVELKTGDDDAIAASVMSNILGGGVFGGRLMQNLREDKAFTYGARASISRDSEIGAFSAFASVRNEVTDSSVVEFLYEIDRLTREAVEDTTLEFIKNY